MIANVMSEISPLYPSHAMEEISQGLRERLKNATTANTRDTYASALKSYIKAATYGSFAPFPITSGKLTMYASIAHTHLKLLAVSIPTYISGIVHFACIMGQPNPRTNNKVLDLVLSGNTQLDFSQQKPVRRRLPITGKILEHVVSQLKPGFQSSRLKAYMLLSRAGWFRANEIVMTKAGPRSNWGDLSLAINKTDLILHQRSSKKARFGPSVPVPLLATGDALCPVNALTQYRQFLSPEQLQPHRPILQNKDGSAYTSKQARSHLKRVFTECGLDASDFNTHSFRIGRATEAGAAGVPPEIIRMLGRWKSDSYQRYIQPTADQLIATAHNARTFHDAFTESSQPEPKRVKFSLGTKKSD